MSLERFHPHGPQHAFPATDQIPPLTGTLRLYVDGTNGNDQASGQGGWGNAWKTIDKLRASLSAVFTQSPGSLMVHARLRGAFSTEDLRWAANIDGNSCFCITHDIADQTLTASGTVTAVTAATEKHGITRLTMGGGFVVVAGMLGQTLRLSRGADMGTSTIIRVDTVNGYLWTTKTTYPAWVVGAGLVTADCFTPSMSGTRDLDLALSSPDEHIWSTAKINQPMIIGCVWDNVTVGGSGRLGIGCHVLGNVTYPMRVVGGYIGLATDTGLSAAVVSILTDAGYMSGAGYCLMGNYVPNGSSTYCVYCGRAGQFVAHGYYAKPLYTEIGAYLWALYANIGGMAVYRTSYGSCQNTMSRGQIFSAEQGALGWFSVSFLDLPAAGIVNGLVRVVRAYGTTDGSWEGTNDGTGATLYGLFVDQDGNYSGPAPSGVVIGKHGNFRAVGAVKFNFESAVTVASCPGGGPDVYVESCEFRFADNFTKSLVNSETAIQNGVDGQIIAAGTIFTAASAAFTAAHVGRSIKVSGSINPANNAVHLITAYTNPTTVVLGASVGLVNEGPGLTWGLVGTPQPILEVARGGRVSQASGQKSFNIRHPEVDPDTAVQEWNNYGYGPNGAIYEHENAEVTLGTLVEAAGAANATGIAAKIKNESKLLHTGGAVLLGVAPLDLGGNAAAAWPATVAHDYAAATPQGCRVIANV